MFLVAVDDSGLDLSADGKVCLKQLRRLFKQHKQPLIVNLFFGNECLIPSEYPPSYRGFSIVKPKGIKVYEIRDMTYKRMKG